MRRAQRQTWIHWGSLLVLTALLLLSSAVALAAESYPFTTVTNDKVNMRRNASSTSVVLERVSKGDTITVLGESGNYYKISYKNRTGYVIKRYVNVPGSAVAAPTQEPTATGYPYDTVTSDSVNLRERASTHSDRLASIPKGAAVTVHSVSGSFAKVTYNGQEGYCMTDYLVIKAIVKATATPVPVPTLTPEESASGYQVLQKGVSNSHVEALQEALIELGYLTGSADGTFGNATESAVVAFQQMNKYPDTGIVDANLQAFLYSGKPLNFKGQKTSIKTLSPVSGVTIRLNNTGALVRTVQTRLKELGYYAGEVTGAYDKATRSAVLAFQRMNDLKADGLCGPETQAKLLGAFPVASGSITAAPTAAPTPAPTFIVPTEAVRKGSTGDAARVVQQRLKDLGYLHDAVDGKFGSASVAALESFQTKHGLKADGVAGDDTYAILFSYNAISANALPTAAPTAAPTIAPPVAVLTGTPQPITKDNVVLVKLGVKGDAVIRLQQRLTQLGYYSAAVDGECKADDVAAIKAFQRLNSLKVDGTAGYDTQVKMYSPSAVTYTGAIAGGTVDTFATLRKGMNGDEVRNMQNRLIELGYLSGAADGIFGTVTSEAVYAFQKANGLVRDGIAGSSTLSKLYSATSAAATPAPATTPAPVVSTLRKGDANDAVRQMQARLIALGYLSGSADGKFGVQTYRALLAFQRANSLLVDGIAGSKTLTRLNSSSAAGVQGTAAPTLTVVTTPAPPPNNGSNYRVTAAAVRYANWYSEIRAMARQYPYATVYDFSTGISWQVHMFSLGAHADSEPLTAADTAKMERAFGGNTWNPKAVWVIFGDGTIYMASTHSMPHDVQHIRDNNFNGHICIHFPRTASQVAAIGRYATSHQKSIDTGWSTTQSLIR